MAINSAINGGGGVDEGTGLRTGEGGSGIAASAGGGLLAAAVVGFLVGLKLGSAGLSFILSFRGWTELTGAGGTGGFLIALGRAPTAPAGAG